ncbi:Ig-like domain-containing protein, partial [Thermodesulfobacteriota bacterium]
NALTNDTDVDGTIDPTTVQIVSDVSHGATSVNPTTGEVTYTPAANYNGADSFTYTVRDDDNDVSNTATVSINVGEGNDPPVVSDIPDQSILDGETFLAINLDNYVIDVDNADDEISWDYSGNSDLNVSIVNRVATITSPSADWHGAETITFIATDPSNLSASDSATFTVTIRGNINNDNSVDLADLILSIQINSGISTASPIDLKSDVNGDNRIDLTETIYILQTISGLRN